MKVVINIEANGLTPDKIWCIVCKDIDTGELYVFRNPTDDEEERKRWEVFSKGVSYWIGHNALGYDLPVLTRLLGDLQPDLASICCDTLVVSKLVDYPRVGHSTTHYAKEFGIDKPAQPSWIKYSEELVDYCKILIEITHRIYLKYLKYISKEEHSESIYYEQWFQLEVVNSLSSNGFFFNTKKAKEYLGKVTTSLDILDKEISTAFPPKLTLVREVTPKLTKHGTISRTSIPRVLGNDLSYFSPDAPFCFCSWQVFNPASHKQIIDVLSIAGWKPTDKTQTAIDNERELQQLKYSKHKETGVDLRIQELYTKINNQEKYGWKINEVNLLTLPPKAPLAARLLAKRILLESRRRTLTEWLGLVEDDGRIHGKFYGIGAWTHRMAHQAPNTANIPNEYDTAGNKKLLGKEMRSLWCAPKNRLLVGVDAEGIQLRIFAHYIDDPEFTQALVDGKKENKSDPHSLNQRILGEVCKSRQAAKRFIYALLLGAGIPKLSEILGCDDQSTRDALERLMERYTGFSELKRSVIPADARRGWFRGLDGRRVRIPGDTVGYRGHLCMSGYLQNGEAVVMKRATYKWHSKLKEYNSLLVNLVHDEWQTETENNIETALKIARLQADSLREVGEDLKLKCPLAGSFFNDDIKDYTIGTNWSVTH